MTAPDSRRFRIALEAACLLIVTVVVVVAGFQKLRDWNGPAFTLTNELYIPSAMFAHGRGFINPPLEEAPGLREFLYPQAGQHKPYDASGLPEAFSRIELDAYQRYHRYLVYAMGMVWRIGGVSWDSAKFLAVFQYLCCSLVAYGILRLFMNRYLSVVGVLLFACSPVVANVVFNIRDFSKAPFLLGTIGILLYLITQRRSPRNYLRAALVLGAVVGIGLGFRRDLLVAFPPVLLLLCCAPLDAGGVCLRRRMAALGSFALVVLVLGWPVFSAFRDEGSLVYHDVLMGMSTSFDDKMGLERTCYERIPVRHDAFIWGSATNLTRRLEASTAEKFVYTGSLHGSEPDKKRYFREMVLLFPADMILRAQAAVLRVCNGVDNDWSWGLSVWSNHIESYGMYYCGLCLAAAAALHPGGALLALVLLLYFGGINSLQYEFRHAFHMMLVPVLCFLLPLQAIGKVLAGAKSGALLQVWARRNHWAVRRNLLRFGSVALCITLLPWLLSLPVQLLRVGALRSQMLAAPITPVETRSVVIGDWTYFVPVAPLKPIPPDPEVEYAFYRPVTLMAEFGVSRPNQPFHVLTESHGGQHDFSMLVRAWPNGVPLGGGVKYFFSLPERHAAVNWVRFSGVGLPTKDAASFKGLFQITDPAPLGTNPNLAVSAEPERGTYFQRLHRPYGNDNVTWFPDAEQPLARTQMRQMQELIRANQLDEATKLWEECKQWGVFPLELHAAKAEIARRRGDEAGRTAAIIVGLAENPHDNAMAYLYEEWIVEQGPSVNLASAWQRAADVAPGNPIVANRLDLALQQAAHQPQLGS